MRHCAFWMLLACALSSHAERLRAEGLIETVAGSGSAAKEPAEGQATTVPVSQPFGVEIGPDGALYITEVGHHRIRRLDLSSGQLTTVAGCGEAGYSGDGGPATQARLNEPYEIRFDREGNWYFVEMQNHVVRRVDAQTGVISTVAGTGAAGYSGDGGPATSAQLRIPHSVVVDARGNLYIADIGNHRIRRVDGGSGRIETIAGNGQQQLPVDGAPVRNRPLLGPRALYLDGTTLWIALREGHSVWRLDLTQDRIYHVAGTGKAGYSGDNGPAREATFDGPKGIAVGPNGRVYVVDTENHVIREVDPTTGRITTVAGSGKGGYGGDGGPATSALMDRPHGICVGTDGSLYIGDTLNHRVRRVQLAGGGTAD